jgi:ABC-type antimicrobial peptide transport system permease subunit
MRTGKLHIVIRSFVFYRSSLFIQGIIIALLAAVITGSLLTGSSVRKSLRDNSGKKLGRTGILVSSGPRYFEPSLASAVRSQTGYGCSAFLETDGYCQNFSSGRSVNNVNIFGIDNDFFKFHGNDTIKINNGEAFINLKLARNLEIKKGDDIIIRFRKTAAIPSNAPFAPDSDPDESLVLTVAGILTTGQTSDFSLSISQIVPSNVFFNISDAGKANGSDLTVNRMIIERSNAISPEKVSAGMKKILKPEYIGLQIDTLITTGGYEVTSKRIFIDNELTDEIMRIIPAARPVITYLANSITSAKGKTPYSFVSALPGSLYQGVPDGNNIVINRWLADDLSAKQGDTLTMSWYVTTPANDLKEKYGKFVVSNIAGSGGIWSDSTLMPDFPGISGRESCSDWDAGIPVNLDAIRKKDEDYWNRYKGTPKAFLGYETGKELWGNNFGPATSIRFPADMPGNFIRSSLQGSVDPLKAGFSVRDIYSETMNAASQGVDFSSLFLSLAFFIILSSILLLSLIVSVYFDSRKSQIYILRAIGFKRADITSLLFYETLFVALAGSMAGVFAGALFNLLVIEALNSVWIGAVQTDTLKGSLELGSMFAGLAVSVIVVSVFLRIKTGSFLKSLDSGDVSIRKSRPHALNKLFMILSFFISALLLSFSFLSEGHSMVAAFAGGSTLLVFMVLAFRHFILGNVTGTTGNYRMFRELSLRYFSFYPSHFVTPVLFIAAGLFILTATGANRREFSTGTLEASSGTGGYLLWCETSIPLTDNLSSQKGRSVHDLDVDVLKDVSFISARKASGDDASCLNLNHITSPPLIGLDPASFIADGSFSFAGSLKSRDISNPWELLNHNPGKNIIYGIADQTVMQWGLKLRLGDTLFFRSENGEPFKVILAAGLKSSIFQGNVIINAQNFSRFMPSVSGSNILLVKGRPELTDTIRHLLSERLSPYGISTETTAERLAEFNQVTNTYLSVFTILGAFGLTLGVIGLGFILMRNYNLRKREYALMLSVGFSLKDIKFSMLGEQIFILFAGISAGILPAFLATWPSLSSLSDLPWNYIIVMIISVSAAGLTAIFLSMRVVDRTSLIRSLRRE